MSQACHSVMLLPGEDMKAIEACERPRLEYLLAMTKQLFV